MCSRTPCLRSRPLGRVSSVLAFDPRVTCMRYISHVIFGGFLTFGDLVLWCFELKIGTLLFRRTFTPVLAFCDRWISLPNLYVWSVLSLSVVFIPILGGVACAEWKIRGEFWLECKLKLLPIFHWAIYTLNK